MNRVEIVRINTEVGLQNNKELTQKWQEIQSKENWVDIVMFSTFLRIEAKKRHYGMSRTNNKAMRGND